MFELYAQRLKHFYKALEGLHHLEVVDEYCIGQDGVYNLDKSKITISVKKAGITGQSLQELLRTQFHIITEMAAPDYVLAMTSICDTEEGLERLVHALLTIDKSLKESNTKTRIELNKRIRPLSQMRPWETMEKPSQRVSLKDSEGRISAAFVGLYPPGIPLIVPGERIDKEHIEYLQWVKQEGYTITGLVSQEEEVEVIEDIKKLL